MAPSTMKAAVCARYGPPETISVEDVPVPEPSEARVRVRVRAASLNVLDWGVLQGGNLALRLMNGRERPRADRPGVDLAGEVESCGPQATRFPIGSRVFGLCVDKLNAKLLQSWVHSSGSHAEYVCAWEQMLAPIPDRVTFEEAAAIPLTGLTALQALRNVARVAEGQSVLVNGASGGVGTMAVQIAKIFGAEVTGVCGSGNVELVRSLGAGSVIDYQSQSAPGDPVRYDAILDCAGTLSVNDYRRLLKDRGVAVLIGEMTGRGIFSAGFRLVSALAASRLGSRRFIPFLARPNEDDLAFLALMLQQGKLRAVIDKRFPLSELPRAIHSLNEKRTRGKIVILT